MARKKKKLTDLELRRQARRVKLIADIEAREAKRLADIEAAEAARLAALEAQAKTLVETALGAIFGRS